MNPKPSSRFSQILYGSLYGAIIGLGTGIAFGIVLLGGVAVLSRIFFYSGIIR